MEVKSLHVGLHGKLFALSFEKYSENSSGKTVLQIDQIATTTHKVFEIWNMCTALVLMLMRCIHRFIATSEPPLNKTYKGLA